MLKMVKTARVALPLALCLAGCQTAPKKSPLIIPASLFECDDLPDVPRGDFPDSELAKFILNLSHAHSDCKDALGDVKNLLEVQGVTVTDVVVTQQQSPWWQFKG